MAALSHNSYYSIPNKRLYLKEKLLHLSYEGLNKTERKKERYTNDSF